MTPESLLQMFDAGAQRALLPLVAVAAGLGLLLVCGVVPALRAARTPLFAATLAAALWAELRVLADPPGPVLEGTYRADATSAVWGVLFLAGTLLAWLYSRAYYREDRSLLLEHDALMLTTPAGMMLMAGAQDLIVFFIGLELLSVPLYALAAFRRNRPGSVEAGLKYFLLGAFAAAFFVYGSALLYVSTGSLSLAELRQLGVQDALGWTGVAFIAASLLFKVSAFPFQFWTPDVYQGSPTPVTVLMATGTKAAAVAFLLNATFLLPERAALTVAVLALLTMAAGNLGALVQDDVKRMLAYSSVAHAGTVLLVVAGALAGDPLPGGAVEAALFYMGAYVFTAAGAFGLLAVLERDGDHFTSLASLRGLARTRPGVAAAMTLFLLSLGGIPATGGFLGKYLVFYVAVRADLIAVTVVAVLLSVVALGYYLRVVVAMFMQPAPEGLEAPRSHGLPATLATGLCVVMVLAMGVVPGLFLGRLP